MNVLHRLLIRLGLASEPPRPMSRAEMRAARRKLVVSLAADLAKRFDVSAERIADEVDNLPAGMPVREGVYMALYVAKFGTDCGMLDWLREVCGRQPE